MKIITTSIHALTDNGFLATCTAHNLASEFHWNSTETTQQKHTSWDSLSSRSLLNYHPHFTATNKLSREEGGGGEKEWETMKKYEKQSEESNRSTEIGVFRAEGKQRGCFLTAGDMARLQRHSSKKNTWKWQQLLYDSLNHGAAGSADIPICLLCHWSKLAFMSLPSMQFTAALNKASSVYNPMLFP